MAGLFNKTITLLNRSQSSNYSDLYYKTVLNNVCLQIHKTSNNNVTNSRISSRCLFIAKKSVLPKPYLPPKEWLASSDKSKNITFKTDDYIVIGAINEENITDISAINDKYDYVFKIYSSAYFEIMNSYQVKAL